MYCPHTALDAADGGINDWLADHLNHLEKDAKRSVVQPIAQPEGYHSASVGYGRLVEFKSPKHLKDIFDVMSVGLGNLQYAMVAEPKESDQQFKSVGICAGSGSGVLKDCKADLLFTGEMSHHDALRATMLGQTVVTVFHSNSERQFLKDRLAPNLQKHLGSGVQVLVSEEDRDPYTVFKMRV